MLHTLPLIPFQGLQGLASSPSGEPLGTVTFSCYTARAATVIQAPPAPEGERKKGGRVWEEERKGADVLTERGTARHNGLLKAWSTNSNFYFSLFTFHFSLFTSSALA